ncbi:MAG: hypothetical protein JSS55_15925 [Proteobacteria bacterium]|nr:hypothetical protein [Pseudomonadota bacterium]
MSVSLTCDLVAQTLTDTVRWDGRRYLIALGQALGEVPPDFEGAGYRAAFRERAVNRQWFASLLASNAYMEGYSAGRLQQYAGVVGSDALKRDLKRHAADEARHSRSFAGLIFQIFPHLDSAWLRQEAEAHVVDLTLITPCPADYPTPTDDEILNSLILMNLFEIKALYLGNYLKPFAAAHAPAEAAEVVQESVARIAQDECYHIAYTARHIDTLLDRFGLDDVASRIAGFVEMMNKAEDYSI